MTMHVYDNDALSSTIYAARKVILNDLLASPDILRAVVQSVQDADLALFDGKNSAQEIRPAIDMMHCIPIPALDTVIEVRTMTSLCMRPAAWINWQQVPSIAIEGTIVGINALSVDGTRAYTLQTFHGAQHGQHAALRASIARALQDFRTQVVQ